MSLEGKIQVQSDIVPTNDNERMPVTDVKYVKGAPQVFLSLSELVAFHPNKMRAGMPATLINYPNTGSITDFRLGVDPANLKNSSGDTIVTTSNFQQYWIVQSITQKNFTRVWQYSADGPGGGAPVFPYTPPEESNWSNVRDDSKGHKWVRFRDDDIDDNADDIFDNWSVPFSLSGLFQTGDYVENRFRRQAVSNATHTGTGTMTTDKYYIIQTGQIKIDGDITLNDVGYFGTDVTITLSIGRVFKFAIANTYTFLSSGSVLEVLQAPPRTVAGIPNNEPIGWLDTIPVGSDQLWQIAGQKSVYGQLKSDWIIKKIVENPNYVRYSNSPSPHPDTIAGPNTPAGTGTPEDTALTAAGWSKTYSDQNFIATRQDDPGPDLYTNWLVEKINEESGEYTERVFKLFDINLDLDDVILVAPSNRDASKDGWSDTPLQETATQINYISETRKFFNGELKTPWSDPVPYTGKDVYIDFIDTSPSDNFKYDDTGAVTPSEITLTSKLFKGLNYLSEDDTVTITYEWARVYNGGSVSTIIAGSNPADDFYYLGATGGAPGVGEFRDGARLVVKPDAVDGQAVFKCVQTLAMSQGDDLIFTQEFSILDVSDGVDAIGFAISADTDRTIYDSVNLVFVPAEIILRAYWSNINPTIFWYRKITGVWTAITNGVIYTIGGNTCAFNADDLFAADGTAEELYFAVSTHATNPDSADQITNFSDYVTITKLSAAGVGSPGENSITAILANEAHTVVLNSITTTPASGEIGGDGKARTRVEVFDGITRKTYGTDWTIVLSSDNADITFSQRFFDADGSGGGAPSTTDGEIFVSAWNTGARSAKCTATITYGVRTIVKQFSIASTLDAPGAIILDIDSDRGFVFGPGDNVAKNLLAKLFDTTMTGGQDLIIRAAQSTIAAFAAASGSYTFVDRANVVLTGSAGPAHLVYRYNGGTKTDTASYTALDSTEYYTFRWNVNNVWGAQSTDNRRVINRSDITTVTNVIVEAYQNSILKRTRTISVTDVDDGKFYRAWTSNVTKPGATEDLSNQDPTDGGIWPVTVSGVVWRLPTDTFWSSNVPSFAQDAEVSGGTYSWGAVYQLKGEKGDQGVNGNFFHSMFKSLVPVDSQNPSDPAYTTPPAYGAGGSSSTLAEMLVAGWVSLLPTSGVIWESKRYWTGQGVTFSGGGDPSTSPVVGSLWSPRTRITGKDGQNIIGTSGLNGWSPTWAIVAGAVAGTKVIQITGWTGGTGSNPGHIGEYIGSSGFTNNINLAQPVNGDAVEMRFDSTTKFIQWKYITEGGGAWRNLVKSPTLWNGSTAFFNLISRNEPNFIANSAVTPVISKSYPSGTWVNDRGFAVMVEVTAMAMGIRDSGGHEGVRLTLTGTATSSGPTIVDSHRPVYRLDGTSWTNLIAQVFLPVAAGRQLFYQAVASIVVGGGFIISDEIQYTVRIVDKE